MPTIAAWAHPAQGPGICTPSARQCEGFRPRKPRSCRHTRCCRSRGGMQFCCCPSIRHGHTHIYVCQGCPAKYLQDVSKCREQACRRDCTKLCHRPGARALALLSACLSMAGAEMHAPPGPVGTSKETKRLYSGSLKIYMFLPLLAV